MKGLTDRLGISRSFVSFGATYASNYTKWLAEALIRIIIEGAYNYKLYMYVHINSRKLIHQLMGLGESNLEMTRGKADSVGR